MYPNYCRSMNCDPCCPSLIEVDTCCNVIRQQRSMCECTPTPRRSASISGITTITSSKPKSQGENKPTKKTVIQSTKKTVVQSTRKVLQPGGTAVLAMSLKKNFNKQPMEVIKEEQEEQEEQFEQDEQREMENKQKEYSSCDGENDSTEQSKRIQESCVDLLSIMHDTVMETIQTTLNTALRDQFANTVQKMECLCSQMVRNECLISKMYLDLVDKITQQNDRSMRQFKCLCTFIAESRRQENQSSKPQGESSRTYDDDDTSSNILTMCSEHKMNNDRQCSPPQNSDYEKKPASPRRNSAEDAPAKRRICINPQCHCKCHHPKIQKNSEQDNFEQQNRSSDARSSSANNYSSDDSPTYVKSYVSESGRPSLASTYASEGRPSIGNNNEFEVERNFNKTSYQSAGRPSALTEYSSEERINLTTYRSEGRPSNVPPILDSHKSKHRFSVEPNKPSTGNNNNNNNMPDGRAPNINNVVFPNNAPEVRHYPTEFELSNQSNYQPTIEKRSNYLQSNGNETAKASKSFHQRHSIQSEKSYASDNASPNGEYRKTGRNSNGPTIPVKPSKSYIIRNDTAVAEEAGRCICGRNDNTCICRCTSSD